MGSGYLRTGFCEEYLGLKREEVTGLRKSHIELYNLNPLRNITEVVILSSSLRF
jgi:hypothetical protein